MLSAGRSLALALLEAGDKEGAQRVMSITLDKARTNPQDEHFMNLLNKLASDIAAMPG